MNSFRASALTAALAAAFIPFPSFAQQGDGTKTSNPQNVFKPAKVDATAERIAAIKAPAGFTVKVFASDLKNIRIIAVAPDGTVYASRRDQGDVIMLRDADNDGRADAAPVIVANRPGAHGLAIRDNKLYLATVKEVYTADILKDGKLGPLKMIIGDLPDLGQHPNRTLAFGPDGMLYISSGSTCNACNDSNPENATMLRSSPDGKHRTIWASGLRNTIGFDWHPQTGELWGLDHGIDSLGDDQQPEELNKIEKGKMYGWPHVWGSGGITPHTNPPGEISKEEWKARSQPMVLGYTAHAAPMQFVFAKGGSMPADTVGDAFATMRGSWNRASPSGYEIVRIRFANGQPKSIEPFLTGFLTDGGQTHIARPVGLAIARDGALLMGDDANGVIYRIAAIRGNAAPIVHTQPPAGPMEEQANKGNNVPLAKDRAETQTDGKVVIRSSFASGAMMDKKHSEYADGLSPPLSWEANAQAKSYAIILEDPDSTPIRPFVHWLAWNIPPNVTSLPEGLQEQPRLTEPAGVLQGQNSRGSVGYYGPRPPVGDAPHRYHFQILALDTMLDVPFGADRDQLLAAVKGHVVGKGVLIGHYGQKIKPPK